jgi:hypothetical protein
VYLIGSPPCCTAERWSLAMDVPDYSYPFAFNLPRKRMAVIRFGATLR